MRWIKNGQTIYRMDKIVEIQIIEETNDVGDPNMGFESDDKAAQIWQRLSYGVGAYIIFESGISESIMINYESRELYEKFKKTLFSMQGEIITPNTETIVKMKEELSTHILYHLQLDSVCLDIQRVLNLGVKEFLKSETK